MFETNSVGREDCGMSVGDRAGLALVGGIDVAVGTGVLVAAGATVGVDGAVCVRSAPSCACSATRVAVALLFPAGVFVVPEKRATGVATCGVVTRFPPPPHPTSRKPTIMHPHRRIIELQTVVFPLSTFRRIRREKP